MNNIIIHSCLLYQLQWYFTNVVSHVYSIEMSDKVSGKMTSALLAMALAYYHVMEEHVEKDKRTDEIFCTLLNCSKDKIHKNTESQKGSYYVYVCIYICVYVCTL